ncbi:hypothetical protein KY290_008287 [Solanum tuberosum]|uniref:Uncharacterized protein n=1 Tax=Solanum tuberosum TaxID=4113 RepID=A0ABQ7W7Z8_SOLTU|nr:hypothetical protein KY290_008287 [Solanum tuberosum]
MNRYKFPCMATAIVALLMGGRQYPCPTGIPRILTTGFTPIQRQLGQGYDS